MAFVRSYFRQITAGLHRAVEIAFSGPGLRDRENVCAFFEARAIVAPPEAWAEATGASHLLSDWDDDWKWIPALLTPKNIRLAYA